MPLSAYSGLPALRGRNQDDAAVHEQAPVPDEDRNERHARAAAALVVLARLMGRHAAREHYAASISEEDEGHEKPEG